MSMRAQGRHPLILLNTHREKYIHAEHRLITSRRRPRHRPRRVMALLLRRRPMKMTRLARMTISPNKWSRELFLLRSCDRGASNRVIMTR